MRQLTHIGVKKGGTLTATIDPAEITSSPAGAPGPGTVSGLPARLACLPTPLARLYAVAMETGYEIRDLDPDPDDDEIAAVVAVGRIIALNPNLDGDGLRADVVAMALEIAAEMTPRSTGDPHEIIAPSGFVVITGNRVEPATDRGAFATLMAQQVGRDIASASFEFYIPEKDTSD